jgi:hypothetical protein
MVVVVKNGLLVRRLNMFGGFNGNMGGPSNPSFTVGPMGNSGTKGIPPIGISYGTPSASVFGAGMPHPHGAHTLGVGVAMSLSPNVDVVASVGRTTQGSQHCNGASIGFSVKL